MIDINYLNENIKILWVSYYKNRKIVHIIKNKYFILIIYDFYYDQKRLNEEKYNIRLSKSLTINNIDTQILVCIYKNINNIKNGYDIKNINEYIIHYKLNHLINIQLNDNNILDNLIYLSKEIEL